MIHLPCIGLEIPWEFEPFRAADLRRREEQYLDILVQKARATSEVFLFTPPLRNIDDPKEVPTGTCRIEITIYGENAKPYPKEYQIKWDDDHRYKAIRLKEL